MFTTREQIRHEHIIHWAERIIGCSLFSHQDVYDSISREQTGKIIRPLTPCHHPFEAWVSKHDSRLTHESSGAGENYREYYILFYFISLIIFYCIILNYNNILYKYTTFLPKYHSHYSKSMDKKGDMWTQTF